MASEVRTMCGALLKLQIIQSLIQVDLGRSILLGPPYHHPKIS
jgi:hypothetical protein